MAKITPNSLISSISGPIVRKDNTYFRTRNGKVHAYKITNPFTGKPTENQNAMRQNFGAIVRQAGIILKDEQLRAEWQTKYDEYLQNVRLHPRAYDKVASTLRGFIISQLHKQ